MFEWCSRAQLTSSPRPLRRTSSCRVHGDDRGGGAMARTSPCALTGSRDRSRPNGEQRSGAQHDESIGEFVSEHVAKRAGSLSKASAAVSSVSSRCIKMGSFSFSCSRTASDKRSSSIPRLRMSSSSAGTSTGPSGGTMTIRNGPRRRGSGPGGRIAVREGGRYSSSTFGIGDPFDRLALTEMRFRTINGSERDVPSNVCRE